MKEITKITSLLLCLSTLLAGCVSTTMIQSTPSGAAVYADSERLGNTPYAYSDTKIVGSETHIMLRMDGYQDFNTVIVRDERADVGAIIAGCLVYVPFLWVCRYNPVHNYELVPGENPQPQPTVINIVNPTMPTNTGSSPAAASNSTTELVKLKTLLDQGMITQDDFTTLKVKILNDNYAYENTIADQLMQLQKLMDQKLLTREEYDSQKNKLINPK